MVTYEKLLDNARGITSTGYASYMCLLIDDRDTKMIPLIINKEIKLHHIKDGLGIY